MTELELSRARAQSLAAPQRGQLIWSGLDVAILSPPLLPEAADLGLTTLQQHQRQPQREQHTHDDHGDEAHAPERLALNVGDAEP